ncbi:MAG: DUF4421 domain-containing protein [Bacteroidaceae bacterium]|nr:DUF4421 domain-containing protein [Bacteroidaceae bacterium]
MKRLAQLILMAIALGPHGDAASAQETTADSCDVARSDTTVRVGKLKSLISLIDELLSNRKMTTDTMYVARPVLPWTIKMKGQVNAYDMEQYGTSESDYYYKNKPNVAVGASANYKGLSVSFTVSMSKMFGENENEEFAIDYYNNRFGIDVCWFSHKGFDASKNYYHSGYRMDDAAVDGFSGSAYYVFNNKRFSYPAAFTRSWIQKKSAGSVIAGVSYHNSIFDTGFGESDVLDEIKSIEARLNPEYMNETGTIEYFDRLGLRYVALGVGYAYNFVPNRHWLLHGSILPGFIPWIDLYYKNTIYSYDCNFGKESQMTKIKEGNDYLDIRSRPFAYDMRLSVTYTWKNYFIGSDYVLTSNWIRCSYDGEKPNVSSKRWKMRCYFGIRL